MINKYIRKPSSRRGQTFVFSLILTLCFGTVNGQYSSNSIYSLYGIGDLQTPSFAKQSGFGRAGVALKSDGFIHCCLFDQIEDVLKNWFAGKRSLVILEIDVKKMTSPVKYENFEGGLETFPHVYGPINIDAVVNVKFIK